MTAVGIRDFRKCLIERANAMPKTKFDIWMQAQRAYVLRLPKWLVGTWVVSSMAFAVWCIVYNKCLMPVVSRIYNDPVYRAIMTFGLTWIPLLVVLYVIARLIKPPAPTNLPSARINE